MADAETTLRNLLKTLFNDYKDDIKIKALTTAGENYTSAVYAIDISDDDRRLKLFGKVAIVSGNLREAMKAEHLYSTEQYVYICLRKIFNDIEEKHNVEEENRFKFPKFYGCNPNLGEETVILEDLTKTGYHTYKRIDSIDWEHGKSAVTTMAKFHALSFAYEKENPVGYNSVIEKLKYKIDANRESDRMALLKMNDNAINIVDNEDYKKRLKAFLKAGENQNSTMKIKFPIKVSVLVHGDYRTSNLLFKKVNGVLETIVVDYQTVHTGSPVADLLYFVFLGTDEEFRKKYYEALLDHYHKNLALALRRMEIDVADVYSRETFDYELQEMLPSVLRMAVIVLPLVLADVANAPRVDAENADVSSFAIKANDIFVERFNGLIRDCVRWGVI